MRYPTVAEVQVPEEITGEELDRGIQRELDSLSLENAKNVARHLVAVAEFLDDEPERAWEHAQVAVARAGRIAAVREAAGFAAYACGKYTEALSEFRAARRISGDNSAWPVMADCERGLGRPEKAITMAGAPEVKTLDKAGQIEMRIVAAGARRDLGEFDAAIVTLATEDLRNALAPWSLRLRYAYADALAAAGRLDEAREWFSKVVASDGNQETDALARLETLGN